MSKLTIAQKKGYERTVRVLRLGKQSQFPEVGTASPAFAGRAGRGSSRARTAGSRRCQTKPICLVDTWRAQPTLPELACETKPIRGMSRIAAANA